MLMMSHLSWRRVRDFGLAVQINQNKGLMRGQQHLSILELPLKQLLTFNVTSSA
jgi:hypothetical protein